MNFSSRAPWLKRFTMPLKYRLAAVQQPHLHRDALADDLVELNLVLEIRH